MGSTRRPRSWHCRTRCSGITARAFGVAGNNAWKKTFMCGEISKLFETLWTLVRISKQGRGPRLKSIAPPVPPVNKPNARSQPIPRLPKEAAIPKDAAAIVLLRHNTTRRIRKFFWSNAAKNSRFSAASMHFPAASLTRRMLEAPVENCDDAVNGSGNQLRCARDV